MKMPQFFPFSKPFATNIVSPFSYHYSKAVDKAPPPSPGLSPALVVDSNLSREGCSQVIQQLLPPNCASIEGDELKVVGNIPINAGGYADVWEATLGDHDVILRTVLFTLYSRDTRERFPLVLGSPIQILPH